MRGLADGAAWVSSTVRAPRCSVVPNKSRTRVGSSASWSWTVTPDFDQLSSRCPRAPTRTVRAIREALARNAPRTELPGRTSGPSSPPASRSGTVGTGFLSKVLPSARAVSRSSLRLALSCLDSPGSATRIPVGLFHVTVMRVRLAGPQSTGFSSVLGKGEPDSRDFRPSRVLGLNSRSRQRSFVGRPSLSAIRPQPALCRPPKEICPALNSPTMSLRSCLTSVAVAGLGGPASSSFDVPSAPPSEFVRFVGASSSMPSAVITSVSALPRGTNSWTNSAPSPTAPQ